MLQIKWSNRIIGAKNMIHKTSVDGTDCKILEPAPFSSQWYSYKHNRPVVWFEIAVSTAAVHTSRLSSFGHELICIKTNLFLRTRINMYKNKSIVYFD